MELLQEAVPDAHMWWRIGDPSWANPLDPSFAQHRGGRWNPPDSFPTLYLSEDLVTARLNLRNFIAEWPYEPEDLRDDTGPILLGCVLPRRQVVCDAHTPAGIHAAGLPNAPNTETPEQRIIQVLVDAQHPLSQRQIRHRAATRHTTVGTILAKLVREQRVEHDTEGRYRIGDTASK